MTAAWPRSIALLLCWKYFRLSARPAATLLGITLAACASGEHRPVCSLVAAVPPMGPPVQLAGDVTHTVCMEKGSISEVARTALSFMSFALRESQSNGPPRCVVDSVAVYERTRIGNLLVELDFENNSIDVSGPRPEVERAARLMRALDAERGRPASSN